MFSNEDGGTPPDRLLATWGRLTDIEYVYGVELDAEGGVRSSELQGKDHELRPFAGRREGKHPLLYVVTDNNMLDDQGTSLVRFAPLPRPFDLKGFSREVVMDASLDLRGERRCAPRGAAEAAPLGDEIATASYATSRPRARENARSLRSACALQTDHAWYASDGGNRLPQRA